MKMNIKGIAFLLLSALLTGCVGAVVVGAAGSMMVYDRRSISMIERDARIFYVTNTNIHNNRAFSDTHITVTSYNQVVLLTGQVTSVTLKADAEHIARKTPNVRRLYNELTINNPTTLGERSKDALLTSKLRSGMLAEKGLESGSIRIVVEHGDVYLMGIVTHEQADLAVVVARNTRGVQKVVKIFQYIV